MRRRRRRRRCRLRSARTPAGSRASSSRRRTSSRRRRPRRSSSQTSSTHFNDSWAKVDLRFAKTKNLTPYDVLIIASMIEKETIAPDERPLVAAVIYNRLKAGMPLGIDATIRYGLDVPGTESLRVSQLESDNPYNTRNRTRPAADADREPRPRLDAGRRAPGEGRLPLLRAQAGQGAPLLHGQRVGVLRQVLRVRLRLRLSDRRHDQPRRAAAAIPRWGRSRRGCRTPPSRRSRSTSPTSRSVSARAARGRGPRARRARLRSAPTSRPRTSMAAAALCDEVEGGAESVNTLVIRDGRVLGSSTDTEALGDRRPATAAVIGAGGAATAWIAELEARGAEVQVFARKDDWPPRTDDADLVVHATPVKDELLFEPQAGPDGDRPRLPRRRRRDGARRRRSRGRVRARRRARRARRAGRGVVRALDRGARAGRGHARRDPSTVAGVGGGARRQGPSNAATSGSGCSLR